MDEVQSLNNSIAERIVYLRKERKRSQDDVAASLQSMGINCSRGKLSMIETKRRPASALLLAGLKLVFNCEYSDLLQPVEGEMKPNLIIYRRKPLK